MASFTKTPDHYDVIKNTEDPIVTFESLSHYERSVDIRFDEKTDLTVHNALKARVTVNEGDIDNLERVKADQTSLDETNRVVDTKATIIELNKTNARVTNTENAIAHQGEDITGLHNDLQSVQTGLHADIQAVSAQYTTLTGALSTLQTKYGELNTYSGKVDVLQGDISDIWDQINNGDFSGGGSSGGGGSGGGGGTVDAYTKTEANARFALKTSLNSYLTKTEAERTYAQKAALEELEGKLNDLEESLQPVGTIHVNISTSNTNFSKAAIVIRNSYDTEVVDGAYKSQKEQTLVNGETTFTNLKKGTYKSNSWRVGYKKAWEANAEHVKELSSAASFGLTVDTREFTSLPYAKIVVKNESGYDFDLYTRTTNSSASYVPASGFGHRDEDTDEWVNTKMMNGKSYTITISEPTYYDKDVYVVAATGEKGDPSRQVYRSRAIHISWGTYETITATKSEVKKASSDAGLEGPQMSELLELRDRIDAALSAVEGPIVEPSTGVEGPGME